MSDALTFVAIFGGIFALAMFAAITQNVTVWSVIAGFWRDYVRAWDTIMRRVIRALGLPTPSLSAARPSQRLEDITAPNARIEAARAAYLEGRIEVEGFEAALDRWLRRTEEDT